MAAQVKSFHLNSHSKNTSVLTSNMQNMSSARGEELRKGEFRKRAIDKGNNVIQSNQVNDSKKKSNIFCHNKQNQGVKESLNVARKGTEKLSIKENKCKSDPHSKVCYCAPTTHEGSFRCRLHRKKSATENKSSLRLNSQYGIVEFKPQIPRFGGVPCAHVRTHDSLIKVKLSRMDSV